MDPEGYGDHVTLAKDHQRGTTLLAGRHRVESGGDL